MDRKILFSSLVASILSIWFYGSLAAVPTKINPPVIFSYGWPISQGKEKDYYHLDMDTPNIIEIGPNEVSYPPARQTVYEKKLLDYWHTQGKRLVRRAYVVKFNESGQKTGFCNVEELLTRWAAAMEEYGIDGIAIDEFIQDRPSFRIAQWATALKRLRKQYPDKLILCWAAGRGLQSALLLRTIRDYADFCMPEIYYSEKEAEGFPNFKFTRFRSTVEAMEKKAPGIYKKTLIGLGAYQRLWDTDPKIDYRDFLEAQVETIVQDPLLRRLPGLALFAPYALDEQTIRHLDQVLKKHYGERRKIWQTDK